MGPSASLGFFFIKLFLANCIASGSKSPKVAPSTVAALQSKWLTCLATGQVVTYLNLKGENTAYCKQKVLELIRLNKTGTDKKEIRELLKNKLPEHLNEKQKDNKISYFLKKLKEDGLKEDGLIENNGTDGAPIGSLKKRNNSKKSPRKVQEIRS